MPVLPQTSKPSISAALPVPSATAFRRADLIISSGSNSGPCWRLYPDNGQNHYDYVGKDAGSYLREGWNEIEIELPLAQRHTGERCKQDQHFGARVASRDRVGDGGASRS